MFEIHNMDCVAAMRAMPDNSVDSIVCDPPYELTSARPGGRSPATEGKVMKGFMGMAWDGSGIAYSVEMWREALRVLKPGGHLLAFSGSRTYHRMTCAIEDAGFEVRDQIMWLYGSGFPKSLDVSKAMDKAAGAVRQVVGFDAQKAAQQTGKAGTQAYGDFAGNAGAITAPATDAARQWEGWGTALKPAHEPICVARKPFPSTVAANVLQWGTGAMNIDGCRVGTGSGEPVPEYVPNNGNAVFGKGMGGGEWNDSQGRWPANLIHDGSDEVVALFPDSNGGRTPARRGAGGISTSGHTGQDVIERDMGDGSAARFFYCAKTSKADRNAGLGPVPAISEHGATLREIENAPKAGNHHPTVKPTDLMAYLVRLVTPPGGLVLDPFMGSGSTGKACMREGMRFIGCELSSEYVAIAEARIVHELSGGLL